MLLKRVSLFLLSLLVSLNTFSQGWNSLGNQMDSILNGDNNGLSRILIDSTGEKLIVGGGFANDKQSNINNILLWDGLHVTTLDKGLYQNPVRDISYYKKNLFAAVTNLIEYKIELIGKWDGISWSEIPQNKPKLIGIFMRRILKYNGSLYALGDLSFDTSTFPIVWSTVMAYDGTQWDFPNHGIVGVGFDLEVFNNELYVCGGFDSAGSSSNGSLVVVKNIVKWDGVNWSKTSTNPMLNRVIAMEVHNDTLYASNEIGRIYRLVGTEWKEFAFVNWTGDPNYIGIAGMMKSIGDSLIVGGTFSLIDSSVSASNLAVYYDGKWSQFETGISDPEGWVNDIVRWKGDYYVGGHFKFFDKDTLYHLVRWGMPVGMEEVKMKNPISIVPNPNNGQFRIDIGKESSGQIEILDVSGKLQYKSGYKNKLYIDLNYRLEKGIYLLRVTNETVTRSSKLLVTE